MVYIDSEGKFNENTYLIDAMTMNLPNSKIWNAQLMKVLIEWMIAGLK